ncbi:hypothetical protein FGO68_gene793 [Halteria grandinella]|uniref:Uncharacterized protein n=1 Tax=Halteria grandinella TaxID=5974 RepID=A0A8J8NLF0_HALGN|nr:hypothetical protein FGO68_gene793 [Halteria grandinella]
MKVLHLIVPLTLCLLLLTHQALAQLVDPDPDPSRETPSTNTTTPMAFSLIQGKKYVRAATLSFVQLLYEIALIDCIDCINYALTIYDHLYDTVVNLINLDFLQSFHSVALAVHKSPVVYRECLQVYNDTDRFMSTFTDFSLPVFAAQMGMNLALNFIDIYIEAGNGIEAMQTGNYSEFGIQMGKITSDLFVKNPMTKDWTFNNSEVFMQEFNKNGYPGKDYLGVRQDQLLWAYNSEEEVEDYSDEFAALEQSLQKAQERLGKV